MTGRRLSMRTAWMAVVRHPCGPLSKNARLVALVIGTHMDMAGGSCHPSLETIALETSLALSSVKKAKNEIESHGLFEIKRGGGRKLVNEYQACIPAAMRPLLTEKQAAGIAETERLGDGNRPLHGPEYSRSAPKSGAPRGIEEGRQADQDRLRRTVLAPTGPSDDHEARVIEVDAVLESRDPETLSKTGLP